MWPQTLPALGPLLCCLGYFQPSQHLQLRAGSLLENYGAQIGVGMIGLFLLRWYGISSVLGQDPSLF